MVASVTEQIFAAWDGLSTAEAEGRFRTMLATSETGVKIPGEQPPTALSPSDKAQVLTQLARAIGLQHRFADANKVLDEAQTLYDEEPLEAGAKVVVEARITLERGRVLNSSGSKEEAAKCFESALETASKGGSEAILSYLKVDALHMLALTADTKEKRESFAQEGVSLAEASDDTRTKQWLGPLLSNLAWAAMDEQRYADAEALFQRAVAVRQAALTTLPEFVENTSVNSDWERETRTNKRFDEWKVAVWSVGHAQLKGGKEDEALKTLTTLLTEADGPAIQADLARIYAKKGDKTAVTHANKALGLGAHGTDAHDMKAIIEKFNN